MPTKKDTSYLDMTEVMINRSNHINSLFRQIAVSQVSNPELFSILNEVDGYWKEYLRPSLTSFCCEAVGGRAELAIKAGLMFTMVASGLSIHDDILDESLKKRSRQTILGNYGRDKALLVGDLLLLKAWTLLTDITSSISDPQKVVNIMNHYSVTLCEAQFIGITFKQNFRIKLEDYENYLFKLNADLIACSEVGAIIGNGSEPEIRALGEFGKILGFILGLKDDLKDTCDRSSLFHKLKYELLPYPVLYSVKYSKELEQMIKTVIKQPYMTSSEFKIISRLCSKVGGIKHVQNTAQKKAKDANEKLKIIRPGKAKNVLESILYQMLNQIETPWP